MEKQTKINLIYGKSGTGKSEYLYKDIDKKIDQYKNIYIIVPEQSNLTSERKFFEITGRKAMLNVEVLTLSDIGWDLGDIDENGSTLEENSLIKAKAIYKFCQNNNINYHILTDDSRLFVEVLNGEPVIYTARYAVLELKQNPLLPKYECVNKLLKNMCNKKIEMHTTNVW